MNGLGVLSNGVKMGVADLRVNDPFPYWPCISPRRWRRAFGFDELRVMGVLVPIVARNPPRSTTALLIGTPTWVSVVPFWPGIGRSSGTDRER